MNEEILNEETIEEPRARQNPFAVISKEGNENGWHDLQTNSSWSTNVYGEGYAIVPDEMVQEIMETHGFCDIELNEDGTEVVSFTPREIPNIPEPEHEPSTEERISELEQQQITTEISMTDMDLQNIETEQRYTDLDLRLTALEE